MTAGNVDVGIVVLNWERAALTQSCLESLLSMPAGEFSLYVIDNGSQDNSPEQLRQWLRTHVPELREVTVQDRHQYLPPWTSEKSVRCTLALNGINSGYAGGNNLGIRLALSDGCEWIWLLNNDTKAHPDALHELRASMSVCASNVGLIGMSITEYNQPDRLQTLGGGRYNKWLSRNSMVHAGAPVNQAECLFTHGPHPDYPSGASMLLRSQMLADVGLLSEEYWAYYEELDLRHRAARRGWAFEVAPRAIVAHLFGGTLGSALDVKAKSPRSAYYGSRGAVLFALKFDRATLPSVVLVRCTRAILMALRARYRLSLWSLRGVIDGLLRHRDGQPR